MPEKEDREITPHRGGFFEDFLLRIQLIIRLMGDSRVNPLLKLVPLASLVYFIMPDLAPGPVDDVAVIWIGLYLFVELCPPEVVAEHMQELTGTIPGQWRDIPDEENNGEVIEGEFREEE
ncbi:MAG: hypothetical protein P8Y03_00620 [Anaerolineales bacterium]